MSYDFDAAFKELAAIEKTDHAAFAAKRKEILENNLIKMANGDPERLARCRAIQWRIDQDINKYSNPVARLNKIIEMFWKQVAAFQVSLNTLEGENEELNRDAEIIQFTKPDK